MEGATWMEEAGVGGMTGMEDITGEVAMTEVEDTTEVVEVMMGIKGMSKGIGKEGQHPRDTGGMKVNLEWIRETAQ